VQQRHHLADNYKNEYNQNKPHSGLGSLNLLNHSEASLALLAKYAATKSPCFVPDRLLRPRPRQFGWRLRFQRDRGSH
jgi:hypothetical protein